MFCSPKCCRGSGRKKTTKTGDVQQQRPSIADNQIKQEPSATTTSLIVNSGANGNQQQQQRIQQPIDIREESSMASGTVRLHAGNYCCHATTTTTAAEVEAIVTTCPLGRERTDQFVIK